MKSDVLLLLLLLHPYLVYAKELESHKQPDTALNEKLSKSFNEVLKKNGRQIEDIYDKSLFDISKSYLRIDQNKISQKFQYNPDLINYITKHSYLEVIWCFKLNKDMSFKKTFEKIKTMEKSNKFTIYSATGSKIWPSDKTEPRHTVCDTISKQPITNGLYENFLVPARCKSLGIKIKEFNNVKNFFNLEQYATRLEFAQALHIEVVEQRIKPKILDAIISKLDTLSYESILLRESRANGNRTNKVQPHVSILKLIADSYHISRNALVSVLRFYTGNSQRISILNEASFKSIAHFIKNPKPDNTSFGEIFEHVEIASNDLKRILNTPIIVALDKNHILNNVVNKTLLNAIISIVKEPGDVIMSFYQLSPEIRKFIEITRMSKFHVLISQSSIRIEHLSIHYFIDLLQKQTIENLHKAVIKHNNDILNQAFISSIKDIIKRSTLVDFMRIYHKKWGAKQLRKKTLLKLAVYQGMTGNEFLKAYNMDGRNISEITMFTNYTFDMIKTKNRRQVEYYTLEELGDIIKKEIDKIVSVDEDDRNDEVRTTIAPKTNAPQKNAPSTPEENFNKKDKILRPQNSKVIKAMEIRDKGVPPVLIIAPTLVVAFGCVFGLAGWVYYAKRKAWRSAW